MTTMMAALIMIGIISVAYTVCLIRNIRLFSRVKKKNDKK